MWKLMLAGLLKIELPGHTVRLGDGNLPPFAGEEYRPTDSLFGVLNGMEPLQEGVGEEAPAFTLSFLPAADAVAADLIDPAYQGARLRLWTAEVVDDPGDPDDGMIVGVPALEFDGVIDVPRLRFPASGRVLELDCVSAWQRLMNRNEGNVLNGPAHRRVWPNEDGLKNTTGVGSTFAWGTNSVRGVR